MKIEDIAEVFQARISQVREALMYLIGAGVLEFHHKQGIYIAKDFSSAMLDPMIYSVILGQSEDSSNLKEMQKFIELAILTLTAIKVSKSDISQLSEAFDILHDDLNKKNDVTIIVRDENEFYIKAFNLSQNEPLMKLATTIRIFTSEARIKSYKKLMKLKRYDKLIQNREQLFEALSRKDSEAVSRIVMNDFSYK